MPASGTLLRRYRAGEAAIPGFLDDYALFTQALLDLYEAQFDPRTSGTGAAPDREACASCSRTRNRAASSVPARTTRGLILRVKEDYDGAEPSGNSVAVLNLLRLAADDRARRVSANPRSGRCAPSAPRLSHAPIGGTADAGGLRVAAGEPREIVIAGEDAGALAETLHRAFVPNRIVLLRDSAEMRRGLSRDRPVGRSRCSRSRAAPRRTCAATIRASCPFPNRRSSPS